MDNQDPDLFAEEDDASRDPFDGEDPFTVEGEGPTDNMEVDDLDNGVRFFF